MDTIGTIRQHSTKFLYSVVNASELSDIGFVTNPYSEFFDPTDMEFTLGVRMFLWMPDASYFNAPQLQDTTIVAICDAGVLELEKRAALIDFSFLDSCYQFSPSKLSIRKKENLVNLMGQVLPGTFVFAAVIPKALLGSGLKSPKVGYQSLINLILVPLAAAHSQLGCQDLNLSLSLQGSELRYVAGFAKKILKSAFPRGNYSLIDHPNDDQITRFYFYSARFISWAVGKSIVSCDNTWFDLLQSSFKKQGGLSS